MIASMRKPAISADLQATRKRAMLMENYELGKVGLWDIKQLREYAWIESRRVMPK
jgi:hypothetical protein